MPGTGKSTLVKFIVAELGLNDYEVCYATYTGKAAQVLKSKGCNNVATTHKLLYKSFRKSDGSFAHMPLAYIGDYKLIVIDEVSMLPKKMWDLLLSHKIHVIALGDPGQLPPVSCEANGILDYPHIFLDEIMRQAAESEIIRLSKDIREGKPLPKFKGKEVNVVSPEEVVSGMYEWADQIICGKNETRQNINNFCRKLKWKDEYNPFFPIDNDKIICLHNDWETLSDINNDPLINGAIGVIRNPQEAFTWVPKIGKIDFLVADFIPDTYIEDSYQNLPIDYKMLNEKNQTVNKNNFKLFPKKFKLNVFDYGYAITAHKAQGSEYGKILLFEEVLRKDIHAKWLYTGITRAKDKITIVKQY